jgi:hypothetical protein
MNFSVLVIFLSLLIFIPNLGGIHAQNIENDLANTSIPIDEFRSSSSSKIHSILIKWQTSDNPNEFAKENNLSYREDKIGVYIFLESTESRSKIPHEITVTAFNEKILVAFVSSEQLDKLEKLDFIERITPPDLARTHPISQVKIPESQTTEENRYDFLLWFVIGGIAIIAIGIFKKRMKLKD